MDLRSYEIFDPYAGRAPYDLSRAEAKLAFEALMSRREQRKAALAELVGAEAVLLGASDSDIQNLNEWFFRTLSAESWDSEAMPSHWVSIVNDVSLFLGDVFIERHPNLQWILHTFRKNDLLYHSAVISGFRSVANPKYTVGPFFVLEGYAIRIVGGARRAAR